MFNPTVGSLFDGSGGFPLGGLLCGIEPLWASEVEPFPIRVTTRRMPQMKSSNPHSGIYEAKTARTLDTSVPDPNKNAGGMAVVSVQGSMIGRKPENVPQGSGVGDDVSFTEADRRAVCYQDKAGTLCASDYKFPQNRQIEEGKAVVERVIKNNYIVRRLTPTECALLQGLCKGEYYAKLKFMCKETSLFSTSNFA